MEVETPKVARISCVMPCRSFDFSACALPNSSTFGKLDLNAARRHQVLLAAPQAASDPARIGLPRREAQDVGAVDLANDHESRTRASRLLYVFGKAIIVI
jgi:hypothetical protein